LLPAHGPPVATARERIDFYIEHRTARENSILAALKGGAMTPTAIVAEVYTDTDPRAYPLAEMNVRAHLGKLLLEGRVAEQGDGFELA